MTSFNIVLAECRTNPKKSNLIYNNFINNKNNPPEHSEGFFLLPPKNRFFYILAGEVYDN